MWCVCAQCVCVCVVGVLCVRVKWGCKWTAMDRNEAQARTSTLTLTPTHHPWTHPGTMTRRRFFHVSGSAGMRPLPMMGAKISASMPCGDKRTTE